MKSLNDVRRVDTRIGTSALYLIFDQLLASINDVIKTFRVPDCNVTCFEPTVWSYGILSRCWVVEVTLEILRV